MIFASLGYYSGIQVQKPLNPFMGETYQGFYSDGTEIYVEHLQHNPSVDTFYIVNKKLNVKLYGSLLIDGNIFIK